MLLQEPQVRRWTKQEYHQAAELGWFEGQRVELIEGEVIEMAPQKDAHAFALRLAAGALQQVFSKDFTFLIQMPLNLAPNSEPEPDIAVVKGSLREVREHPRSAELIVEIADTSLLHDRRRKAQLYANAGIADYWIVNVLEQVVEVYRLSDVQPLQYASPQVFRGERIQPLAAASEVSVDDLLP